MIVIAEDDDTMRTVLAHALERCGHAVTVVADGQLVWPTIAAGSVDLLILDLRLPGMNGWEVLRRLKDERRRGDSRACRPPVIVISAQNDPETQSFVLRLGATAFMAKPLDLGEFHRAVRAALRGEQTPPV